MQDLAFTTERLRIDPWSEADAEWYLAEIDDDAIRRWTRENQGLTVDAWRNRLEQIDASSDHRWSRIRIDGGDVVGSIGAVLRGDILELRYWVAGCARNRGYATEALEGAVAWGRSTPGVEGFQLDIHPDNIASRRVAERAGFSFDRYEASCDTCADDQGRVAVYARSV